MALKPTRHPSWSKLRATGYEESGLVLATGKSAPLDAQNIMNRFFKPLLKRSELPDIRWHDLRHTCCTTLLLARGTHPTYLKKSLGYASVQLTPDPVRAPVGQHHGRDNKWRKLTGPLTEAKNDLIVHSPLL
jgi:integrase